MLGAIIKKYRLMQNLSQESLCKGICSISYLSKIETGQVVPNSDLYDLLLERLKIGFPREFESTDEVQKKVSNLWEHYHFGDFDAFNKSFHQLMQLSEYLPYSELAIDWHLLNVCYDTINHQNQSVGLHLDLVKSYQPFFTTKQTYYFNYFMGTILFTMPDKASESLTYYMKANQFEHNCDIVFQIAKVEYFIGNYHNTIRYATSAYELAMNEGNLHYAIEATQMLSAAYSNIKEMQTAISLYNRLLQFGNYLKKDQLLMTVYYNLGASYLVCKDYDLANEMFQHLYTYVEHLHIHEWLLFYQKLILCDIALGAYSTAQEKLEQVFQRLKTESITINVSLNASFEWLALRIKMKNKINNQSYLDAIKATYENSKIDSHFGFTLLVP